jgi:hypothetical protein
MGSWRNLPLDLKERIAEFAHARNSVVEWRLIDKSTAAQFRGHPRYSSYKLSEPVPPAAFQAHWTRHAAGLPLVQRQRLLALLAASGDIRNLELAWSLCACPLPPEAIDQAAAANRIQVLGWLRSQNCPWGGLSGVGAGATPDTIRWLMQAGCPLQPVRLLQDAAAAGNAALAACLVRDGGGPSATFIDEGLLEAARGGQLGILDSLLERRKQLQEQHGLALSQPPPHRHLDHHPGARDASGMGFVGLTSAATGELVVAAAEGCALEALQRLHAAFIEQQPAEEASAAWRGKALAAAAGSTAPDWADKLAW